MVEEHVYIYIYIYIMMCRSSTDTALQNIMINELLVSFEGVFLISR